MTNSSKLKTKNYTKLLHKQVYKLTEYTFIRYLLVGCSNTMVCFLVMYLGALAKLHYLSYTALGYFVAILYSFFMNLRFTFRVEGQILKRLLLFFMINMSNLAIVEVIEYVMIDQFYFNRIFSILSAMTWYVATGFLVNRYLVYRRKMR